MMQNEGLSMFVGFVFGLVIGGLIVGVSVEKKVLETRDKEFQQFCLTNNIVYKTNDFYGNPIYLRK